MEFPNESWASHNSQLTAVEQNTFFRTNLLLLNYTLVVDNVEEVYPDTLTAAGIV